MTGSNKQCSLDNFSLYNIKNLENGFGEIYIFPIFFSSADMALPNIFKLKETTVEVRLLNKYGWN